MQYKIENIKYQNFPLYCYFFIFFFIFLRKTLLLLYNCYFFCNNKILLKEMKVQHIFSIFSTILTVAKAYEIKCNNYYSTVKGDTCLTVSINSGVSTYRLKTLNPG